MRSGRTAPAWSVCFPPPPPPPAAVTTELPVPCRTPEERAQGSVPGSINIPIKLDDGKGGMVPNPDFEEQVGTRPPCPPNSTLAWPAASGSSSSIAGMAARGWTALQKCSGAWRSCRRSNAGAALLCNRCCAPCPPAHPARLPQVKAQLSKDTSLVCTCAHGRRGGDATARLAAQGFTTINLEGGLANWADQKQPVDGTIQRHH